MRVALLSCNAQARNAIGNQVAEKAAFFLERGAEVRVYLQYVEHLHPELNAIAKQVTKIGPFGDAWDYLKSADLVVADYAQVHDLLHFLPLLVGHKPRLVLDYHGITPAEHWDGPQRDLLARSARERGIVWCADLAIAHSQFARHELQQATGYPAERIFVQPYPTDAALFQPGSGQATRRKLGLDEQPVLLYVGRLAASKCVPLMIEALPLVPKSQALIVGDTSDVYGVEARRCQELAKRLGVADRVHFLGQLDDRDLADIYRAADVLVIPSLHEGYCLPAVEAMASGLPVVAARTTALPETLGDAGLTFTPNDVHDLARQVCRVVNDDTRSPTVAQRTATSIAIVAFRFGGDIVGGAERSLLTIAKALESGGRRVEVFTTCTNHESAWSNELPAGSFEMDGLSVHRFPIDPHDREAHHDSLRRISAADGHVDADTAAEYLRHSIHSSALIEALRRRRHEFAAIITGPYLFGLTHDVATAFPERTLLLPCYHDEEYARLECWLQAYTAVGGVLYHSPEEQELAERVLGLNHPRATQIGTWMHLSPHDRSGDEAPIEDRYIVYCGRFSQQKNVPLLLEYAERYSQDRPRRFQFVFLGQGEVKVPQAAWASDRGRVGEEEKGRLLAHAAALVQLSRQESLSLVALEAWARGTPVIVNQDCAVLAGQVERANGGRVIGDYGDFARALDDLWERPDVWRAQGDSGRAYVQKNYSSEDDYRQRLIDAVDGLNLSLREHMRQRGLARAAARARPRWRERFGHVVERALDDVSCSRRWSLDVQPQTSFTQAAAGARSVLIPVRVVNQGTMPAFAEGPARTQLAAQVVDNLTGKLVGEPSRTNLPTTMVPGQTTPAAVMVALPTQPGQYQIVLSAESLLAGNERPRQQSLPLFLGIAAPSARPANLGMFLETIQSALAEAHRRQCLPDDYVDVTEGRLANWKRWLKQKLLGNFKKGYVDVLSRQQTQVNQHLLMSVQQLTEYCATLEHALRGLQQRVDELTQPPAKRQEECQIPNHDTMPEYNHGFNGSHG